MNRPRRTFYSAQDLTLMVELDDADLFDPVDQTIRYHGFRHADSSEDEADLLIEVRLDSSTIVVPDDAEMIRSHPAGIKIFRVSDDLVLLRGDSFMTVDVKTGAASIRISPKSDRALSGTNSDLYLLLTFGLVLSLQSTDRFVLHAAALAGPGDVGFLIVAPSGSGKSTLSMRLVESGWRFVSDDSVVLARLDNRLVIWPFRRDAAIFSESTAEYSRASEFSTPLFSDPRKDLIDMDLAYPDQRLESLHPSVVVFPILTQERESAVSKMSPAEALVAIIAQGSFLRPERQFMSRQMSLLKELVDHSALLRLDAGIDLRHDAAAANRILSDAIADFTTSQNTT